MVIDKYGIITDTRDTSRTERIAYVKAGEPLRECTRRLERLRRIYITVIQAPAELDRKIYIYILIKATL